MAEKNHGKAIPEMFLSLESNGNQPSALLPKLGTNTNEPYANLQLSLGGLYDVPNSSPDLLTPFANPPANSVPEGSSFSAEQNRFLQEGMAGIKMREEIQFMKNNPSEIEKSKNTNNTLVSPTLAIPVLAAQSAIGNPALRRALNVIKSNGITSTPRGANVFRGYTSRNHSSVEGFHPQNPIGVPMEAHYVNNRANNPRFSAQPKCVNLVAPTNFPNLCRNFIPNQQSNLLKLVPPFNYFPNTLDQPLNRGTYRSNLMNNSMGAPFATPNRTFPKFPYQLQTSSIAKIHNIPILPQNATRYIHSDIFTNNKVAQFPPISNNTNGNLFMPQSNQPFAKIINTPRRAVVRHNHNPIDPPEYPSKRVRRETRDRRVNEDASEVQIMKKLPIVVTTGGNPNGKKIEGILYKYGNDQEVTIVCVCHGCFFTAEEFVRHAGGGGDGGTIENPKQHISIMDNPNTV